MWFVVYVVPCDSLTKGWLLILSYKAKNKKIFFFNSKKSPQSLYEIPDILVANSLRFAVNECD